MSQYKKIPDPSFAPAFEARINGRSNEELSEFLEVRPSVIEKWREGQASPDQCLRNIVFKALDTGVLERVVDLAVKTQDGFLVLITRMPNSRLKTNTNKRRGTRCALRRYDFVFPSLQGKTLRNVQRGYAFADGDLAQVLRKVALSNTPFYAIVTSPNADRPQIVRLIDSDAAQLAIRKARQLAEDAEWEAAAPENSEGGV